ncbi:MAG: hypothetical protein ACEQSL_00655 [Sediminibacterium sp.]
MSNQTKNGVAAQGAGKPTTDTAKGVAAMAIVEAKKPTVNPYSEKVGKIAEAQRKVLQLQRLREVETDLNTFKIGNEDSQNEYLVLKDSNNRRFETSNAYLAAKVVECLKVELSARIPELEAEILTATI